MMPRNIKAIYSESFITRTGDKLKFVVYYNGNKFLLKLGHEEENEEQIFNKLDLGDKYFNTLAEAKLNIAINKDLLIKQ